MMGDYNFWMKAVPFVFVFTPVFCWVAIIIRGTTRWDALSFSLAAVLFPVGLYFLFLALNFADLFTANQTTYDCLRVLMAIGGAAGLPSTVRHLFSGTTPKTPLTKETAR